MAALRADGIPIQAVTNRGYALGPGADLLSADAVAALLCPEAGTALCLEVYDRLPGTNATLRARAVQGAPEGLALIAQAQSCGRGRSGRSFFSPPGGLYLSLLLRPDCSARQALHLTAMAAVAAARAAESVSGASLEIKWVNDLWKEGQKVCGILTEAALDLESGLLDYAVVGVGFNLVTPAGGWPQALQGIAGALFDQAPPPGTRARLAAAFLNQFWAIYRHPRSSGYLGDYQARQALVGRRIQVLPGHGAPYGATALGVDPECRLLVRPDDGGPVTPLHSGEVRVFPTPSNRKG